MKQSTSMLFLALVGIFAAQIYIVEANLYNRRLDILREGYSEEVKGCIPGFTNTRFNVLDLIRVEPQFSTLHKIVNNFGLGSGLDNMADKVTLFAPTNEAIAEFFQFEMGHDLQLTGATLDYLLLEYAKDESTQKLVADWLSYHVIPFTVDIDQASNGLELQTLLKGSSLHVQRESGQSTKIVGEGAFSTNNSASVLRSNLLACNGLVQVIDTVLVPDSGQEKYDTLEIARRRNLMDASEDNGVNVTDMRIAIQNRKGLSKSDLWKANQMLEEISAQKENNNTEAEEDDDHVNEAEALKSIIEYIGSLSQSNQTIYSVYRTGDNEKRRKLNDIGPEELLQDSASPYDLPDIHSLDADADVNLEKQLSKFAAVESMVKNMSFGHADIDSDYYDYDYQ